MQGTYYWRKFYSIPGIGGTGKIAAGLQVDSNKIVFMGQGEIWGQKPYFFATDTNGNVLSCKVIPIQGMNPDNCPSKFAYSNNHLTFMFNESIGGFGSYFKISSVDTSMLQICNAFDTAMVVGNDNNFTAGSLPGSATIINDSLMEDSLPVSNISFSYGLCNDSTLNIKEFLDMQTLIVFPNPSDGKFVLENRNQQQPIKRYTIYNQLGEKIINEQLTLKTQKKTIDLRNQPEGIYLLQLLIGNKLVNRKLVVR